MRSTSPSHTPIAWADPVTPVAVLGLVTLALLMAGLMIGPFGWSWKLWQEAELVWAIRAPRSLGAWTAGALLGLAGALAQGLFRNPLADPYLLGSAAGSGLAVALVVAAGAGVGAVAVTGAPAAVSLLAQSGLVLAAFIGALAGVVLTVLLAGGAARPMVLLLAGVVVGVLLTAVTDFVMLLSPDALRARQAFLLGTTGLLGWPQVQVMLAVLAVVLPAAALLSRVLDALVLGEASARSLGLPLDRLRGVLIGLLALATGAAVAEVGLVAFVGLMAPHIVRRSVAARHGWLVLLSALAGGCLLLAADLAARLVLAPQELPVGLLTAVVGGVYLLALLRRRALGGEA